MTWNPYTDQKNRAFSGILTSLFPEQTKTVPRILVWSVIFLLDLILGIGAAAYFGLLDYTNYSNQSNLRLVSGLLVVGIFVLFWLQGKIWYGIVGYFQKRNTLD